MTFALSRTASVAFSTEIPTSARITAGRSFRPSPRNPTVCPFVCSVSTSMAFCFGESSAKYLFSQPLWAIHFQKEHPAVLLSDNSLREFRYACKWIVLLVFDLLSAPLHSHEDCEASELHLRHSSLAHQKCQIPQQNKVMLFLGNKGCSAHCL